MKGRLVGFGTSSASIRRGKYNNKPTLRDGIKFASKREAERYAQLKLLERNGEVRNIALQVEYRFEFGGVLICKYRADFVYDELRGDTWSGVVEDCKGYATATYKLKKKLMRAFHGVVIRES